MSLRVTIGGPSYQYQCDARRYDQGIMMTAALCRAGIQIGAGSFVGCPVELARHGVMLQALASGADLLISSDSDTWVDDPQQVVAAIKYMCDTGDPYVAFPVMRRDGTSNVQLLGRPGEFVHRDQVPTCTIDVHAVGAAFVVQNLRWYRDHWATGPWFKSTWDGASMTSEDVWHCRQLSEVHDKNPVLWGHAWARHADGTRVL